MTVQRYTQVWESVMCTPGDPTMLGGGPHQLRVADILEFADQLRDTDPEALVYDTQFLTPRPVTGLQVLRESREPSRQMGDS